MVAPALLQNPSVKRWLGGIAPAWTLLDSKSFDALQQPPHPVLGPIRLTFDLPVEDIERSAMARNTLVLLRAAAEGSGLKLTATGNLSRLVVTRMCDLFTWPGYDKTEAFPLHKVVNEPDFLPLFFVRHVAEICQLVKVRKGHLAVTPAGRRVLAEPHIRALQAVLFHTALWAVDLDYLARGLHPSWPQRDAGIVLWSLSIAAKDWQSRESLTRLCTIPINDVSDKLWDTASYAMEARILRPLQWFGLIESRQEDIAGSGSEKHRFYRKTALFDRFLSFDVKLEGEGALRH
jgi:hypothetical protein